jgi:hypothetical protein
MYCVNIYRPAILLFVNRVLEHLEDLKLAGNDIKEIDEDEDFLTGMSLADASTVMTAKPSLVTATSTSRLLRKQSSTGSKAALETTLNRSKVISRRASLKAKYANMTLEKALALACPTLQTLDDASLDKLRLEEVKKGETDEKDEDGFHTW